ncbi:MAG: substrate-binding domain-containing protein [Anaerolineae bacterium]|nr:substrate-binding domain-containing protein [Anaerolineae bacterium]
MTTFERRQALMRYLKEQPGIKVTELAELLNVSEGTIRNDLTALQDSNQVRRVRGGAVLIEQTQQATPPPVENATGKQRIARRAAEMVNDGDAIWLDAGTTVRVLVPFLAQRQRLTIVTNGLRVALQLAEQSTHLQGAHTVILVGGRIGTDGLYTIGTGNEQLLDMVNIRTAFISGVGFTLEAGLTVMEYEDAQLKSRVLNSAENVVALVDASKFGKRGFAPVATLEQISHLITDEDLSAEMLMQLRHNRVNVTICGENTIRSHTVTNGSEKYTIGFANQSESLSFAQDVRHGLEKAAATRRDIDLVIADNKLSGEEALRVADHLINRKVDIAIEYQIDYRSGNQIIDKFQRANIPVIAVDIPMVGATFFGVDNYRAGYMAGEALGQWVMTHWQGEIDALIILEEQRAGDSPKARIHGQQDAFEAIVGKVSAEKIITLDSGNTRAISQANMISALQSIPDAQRVSVISFNDEAAAGALHGARSLDRETDVVIVGQGCDRLIRSEIRRPDSRLIGSTAYMPERYGAKLLEIATAILQGKSVPPALYVDHVFVTRDNIDQYYPV